MTNLTPIQLEEFESVFRHFDRDMSNTLQELEFSAALASLGLVYDEEEMHKQFVSTCAGMGHVTFEQFIRFMVDVTEDQNTAEQVFQSFKEVADGKVCHTLSDTFICLGIWLVFTSPVSEVNMTNNFLLAICDRARSAALAHSR